MHICDLRLIRLILDFKTASTIATSIFRSKLDYCNTLFLNRCICTWRQRLERGPGKEECSQLKPKRLEVQAKTVFMGSEACVRRSFKDKLRLGSVPIHGVVLCRRSPIRGACRWGGIECSKDVNLA